MNQTTMQACQPAFGVEEAAEASPFVVEFFMVQGLGFRGMAYCDEDGNWRNAFNNDQLMGHIYLLE
jgi:hypothetical protein